MNLEQITFRVDIEVPQVSTFIHFIRTDANVTGEQHFTIKIGDLEMSVDEFNGYVNQLAKIRTKINLIKDFSRGMNA